MNGETMSEKRFKRGYNLSCVDTVTGKYYWYACNLSGLLNEQQATIQSLKEENEQLKEENKYLKKRIEVISDELYCKDRKLEELGVPIECCDKKMSEKRFIEDLDNERFRFKELPNTTIRIWDTLTNQQYFINGMTPDSGWKFCTMFMYFFLETEKLKKDNENYKSQAKLKEWRFVLDEGDIEKEDYHIDLTRVWEVKMENKALRKENEQLRQTIKEYEYQIEKGYTDLTYEEMLEKESDDV